MHILVTGGAGFIGAHLVRALLRQGHRVRVFDNLSSGSFERLADSNAELLCGDVRDEAGVTEAMQGIDLVFHLAALVSVAESLERPQTAYASNMLGTVHVLEAARRWRVHRVVQASTCAVYGNTEALPVTEATPPQPLSPYAGSKLAAEQAGLLYQQLYGLETVALRFFNVYGPGQDPASPYAAVVPRFVDALRRGEQPSIFGDGLQSRDFIFVGDIVRALGAAASKRTPGGLYNIGTGRETTVLDLAHMIGAALHLVVKPQFLPPRDGEVRHSRASVELFASRAGYRPETDLRTGILATVHRDPQLACREAVVVPPSDSGVPVA